jgi:hypothetical protein
MTSAEIIPNLPKPINPIFIIFPIIQFKYIYKKALKHLLSLVCYAECQAQQDSMYTAV